MKTSRINNTILNSLLGIISYLVIMFVTFISRGIFMTYLGAEYLGVNSLFTNIVSMLSLTELGLGTAVLHLLYKPVADKCEKKISALMNFYKKMYIGISVVIIIMGIVATSFIAKIANTSIISYEVQIYFVLFFLNTGISYLWSYKQNLLFADQRNRFISLIHMISKVTVNIIQCISLIIFNSFFLYLILQIIGTILENMFISSYVDKNYLFLRKGKNITIDNEDKNVIFSMIRPILVQNFSNFIVSSTDNIIISVIINVYTVGIYSNYILITNTIATLFSQIFSAFTTSFGNLYVSSSKEHSYDIFVQSQFLCYWLVTVSIALFICLVNPFISLWLGGQYTFSMITVFFIGISLYVKIINVPCISIQNALGLHKYDQIEMVLQGGVNFTLSIILVKCYGVLGVVLGTIISTLIFPTMSKPRVVYKYGFNKPVFTYYFEYIFRFGLMLSILGSSYFVSNFILFNHSVIELIIKVIVVLIISNSLLLLVYIKDVKFLYFFNIIKKMIISRNIV